jgi:hypothetical protein
MTHAEIHSRAFYAASREQVRSKAMKAVTVFLAGGAAIAALASAAPASAQFYPGYGYPGYGYPGYGAGGVIGSIINSVTGSYGGYGNYGYNVPGGSRIAASQCTAAVQQRLGGYGGYGYAYGGAAGGRVLGITSIEIRGDGGYRVRGTATQGGYAYGGGAVGFSCRTDPRGFVTAVSFNTGSYGNRYYGNGYMNNGYGSNYSDPYNPYSVYGYSRY